MSNPSLLRDDMSGQLHAAFNSMYAGIKTLHWLEDTILKSGKQMLDLESVISITVRWMPRILQGTSLEIFIQGTIYSNYLFHGNMKPNGNMVLR
jgi:hypothetical protein